MSKISAVRDRIKSKTIDVFGETVFIRGVECSAIFRDEEYTDEVGTRRILTLSVDESIAKLLEKGDEVYVDSACYKIDRIPTTTDPIIDIELKNA